MPHSLWLTEIPDLISLEHAETPNGLSLKLCLREPIPELFLAAKHLDDAVSAHLLNDPDLTEQFIRKADLQAIRDWSESLWGKASQYNQPRTIENLPLSSLKAQRRMPSPSEKMLLHLRDGHHCRFCGIPVIRQEIRKLLTTLYPHSAHWGASNASRHPTLHAMQAQYDHLLPHSRGGTNDLDNLVITCSPCNYGRGHYTLEEMGLSDPRLRVPIRTSWDGLERILTNQERPHHPSPTFA